MKKIFKYTLPVAALCALASCSDDTTSGSIVDVNNGKELIALSGDEEGVTRAALTRAGFTADTKVVMRIKAEASGETMRYAKAEATAKKEESGATLSNLSYDAGWERYWDDAFGRASKLTVYAFAIPGKTDATLPTWVDTDWQKVDENTNPNWFTGTDYQTVEWSVKTEQNDSTMKVEDLAYSNNISENGKGGRYTFKFEGDAWTQNDFQDGPLTWTPKTTVAGETTGKFDKGHLVFNHSLAWIEINLKEGAGFDNTSANDFKWSENKVTTTTQNLTLTGFNTKGTFNVAEGKWKNHQSESITSMKETESGTGQTTRKLEAYVLPDKNLMETTTNMIEFEIDNTKYYVTGKQIAEAVQAYYTTGAGKDLATATTYNSFTTLEAGKHYVINLSVAKKSIDRITAAVIEWETVNSDDADAKNTHSSFDLADNSSKYTNDDAAKFNLYRAAKVATDYISGTEDKNVDWKSGYETPATKEWDAANNVWKTNWFWENNLTYYHFRAVGNTENNSGTPSATITPDATNGDYFTITSGTLSGSNYKDYIWGAPFNTYSGQLTYSDSTGFDNGNSENHQISQALAATESNIAMLLFHVTSQITVNVYTTTGADKVDLKGDGTKKTTVEILNFLPNGKVLVGNGLVTANEGDSRTANASMSEGSYVAANGTTPDGVTGFKYGIVPQALTWTGGTIGLRITTPDGNQYLVKDLSTCTATVSATNLTNNYTASGTDGKYLINRWFPGYKYTYNIAIKKTGVERITAAVVGWEEVVGDLGTIDLEN